MARRFPLFARFVAGSACKLGPESLVYAYLPVHIARACGCGEFVDVPIVVSLEVIGGAGLIAIARMSTGQAEIRSADGRKENNWSLTL